MDKNLFDTAKLQAAVDDVEAQPTTRHVAAFVAALLVNVAVLGTLEWSAYSARPVPHGQVVITQLDDSSVQRLAHN